MLPAGGRQYKSRKARPCDLCRGRKTACHMENGPPCRLCSERNRQCTFLQAPGTRRRPNKHQTPAAIPSRSASGELREEAPNQSQGLTHPTEQADLSNMQLDDSHLASHQFASFGELDDYAAIDEVPATLMQRSINYLDEDLDMLLAAPLFSPGNTMPPVGLTPMTEVGTHSSPLDRFIANPRAGVALDSQPNVSYRNVGPTGDLDLYVLSHRNYDDDDESAVQYRGLKYRRMSSSNPAIGIPPPVFIVTNDESALTTQPRFGSTEIEAAKKSLSSMISPKLGYRLMLLYINYVHPHFPVLSDRQFPQSPEEMERLPSSLFAAVCAMAIPFVTYDDVLSIWLPESPPEEELFRLAWILVHDELHTPHLSTIQTCLLLLQSHPRSKYLPLTPFKPSLLGMTAALCHCLALHRSSLQWHIMPIWERRLRQRIWWALWMMDKWICLGESVPSVLKYDECDVQPLTTDDLKDERFEHFDAVQSVTHFPYIVSLTSVLDDTYQAFFSVRATERTATNLELSLEVARPLRARLKQWHEVLPPKYRWQGRVQRASGLTTQNSKPDAIGLLDAHGSFHLAYLTVQLTLFRALLRPVSMMAKLASSLASPGQTGATDEEEINGPKAVIKGALNVVEEVVILVESLRSSNWDSFWHSWSRTNFAIASSVMLNLLMILRPPIRPGLDGASAVPNDAEVVPASENTNSFLNLQSEYRTLLDSLTRWRWALKIASRGAGGRKGLMNLSLLRMDALLAELCAPTTEGPDSRIL